MNNLFFKSHETYEKLVQLIETVLTEQRHQRVDLMTLKRQNDKVINLLKLQKQVDDYFEEHLDDSNFSSDPDSEVLPDSKPDIPKV